MTANSIQTIDLVEGKALRRGAEIEMERHRALSDMLHESRFIVKGFEDHAPYGIVLSLTDHMLRFDINDTHGQFLTYINLGLRSLQKLIKDYFMMCEGFYKMVRANDTAKIEAIDMGRRAIHNEGAENIMRRLKKHAEIDMLTARRLFTLICILHIRITV